MLYNIVFAPDLCNQLFSIITLMNLRHTFLFHKEFFVVFFNANEHKVVTLPHNAQIKQSFLV